ncbi:MAG TPA: hypothetical protein VFU47_05580 [Armatimonadota bacterium]|nr:hypothetical protein [Armatimonadota bacterium]
MRRGIAAWALAGGVAVGAALGYGAGYLQFGRYAIVTTDGNVAYRLDRRNGSVRVVYPDGRWRDQAATPAAAGTY